MKTWKMMMVLLAGAAVAASCAGTEAEAAVVSDACRGNCHQGLQCVIEDGDPDSAHCEAKGTPATPSTSTTTFTCSGSTLGTCPSGQTCQLSGSVYSCVVPAGSSTTVNNPGASQVVVNPVPTPPPQTVCSGATVGPCPSGQACQLVAGVYACVGATTGTDWQFANVAFSRSGLTVTATFTGLTTRHWRVAPGTDQEPASMPVYLLPVGGSGAYTWNVGQVSANSAAAKCAISGGSSATCQITAAGGEPFTWQACDRDPTTNNQGCSYLAWFKTERLRVSGATVNSAWNFVVQ